MSENKPVVESTGDDDLDIFQAWAMLADRSPARTSRVVREYFGIEISADAIKQRARRNNWHGKANELFHETAPTYYERTRNSLVGAGPTAARYLVGVAEGTEEPNKERVQTSFGILDRIGFLPMTRREAEQGHSPVARAATAADDWDELTDEQLRQVVAGRVASLPET